MKKNTHSTRISENTSHFFKMNFHTRFLLQFVILMMIGSSVYAREANYTGDGFVAPTTFKPSTELNETLESGDDGFLALNNASLEISPITLTGDFTIESWVYFESNNPITREDGLVASTNQDINFHNGRIRVNSGNGNDIVIASTNSVPDEWAQYAIVRENGITRIYINGQLNATATGSWNDYFIIENIGAGRAGISSGVGGSARFDDFMIWNSARSAIQITSDMRRNLEVNANLLRFYNFDSAESTTEETFNGIEGGAEIETQTLSGDFTVQALISFAERDPITSADGLVASANQDINFHNGQIRVFDRNSGRDQVIANTVSTAGVSTHYAIVRENGITKIYINGVLDATSTTTWTNDFIINRKATGIRGITDNTGLNGSISNLQILNRALSAAEIREVISDPISTSSIVDLTGNSANIELPNGAEIITASGDSFLDMNQAILSVESMILTGDFTIESWVDFDSGETITSADGLVASTNQDINFHNGRIRVNSVNGNDIVIANTVSIAGVPAHYAIVRESGITKIYINGVLDATATSDWNNDFVIDYIGTGSAGVPVGIGLSGHLNDFMIWNTARSNAQITEDMNGDIAVSNDLFTYYSFHGNGPVALDESGNNRNLALHSGAMLINEGTGNGGPTIDPITGDRAVQVSNSGLSINEVTLTDGFSISAWVYFDENDPIDVNDILAQGDGWSIDFDNGVFNVSVAELGGSIVATNTPIEKGKWAFYTAVREEGFVELYINGNFERTSKLDDSSTRATINDPWETNIVVSEIYTGMTAVIDDFRIYNSSRTQTQLQSDLTGTLQGIDDIVRYYSFNGQVDTIIDDTDNTENLARESGTEFTGFIAPFVVPRAANEFGSSQVVNDLILPTDLDFLPDNRLIVVEKSGLVKIYADGSQVNSESGTYFDLRDVTNNVAERGMLAVVVDPEFENNGYVYLYNTFLNANNTISKAVVRYTHIEGAGGANSRLDQSSAFIIWREQEVQLAQAANVHHGGGLDIAFEPIGNNDPSPYKMYIVTSDESIPNSSRNLGSDNGKVHRVNLTDGSIPTDNPYYEVAAATNYNPQDNVSSSVSSAGVLSTIHSFGVRNGWRASYDQVSGHLLFGEVGGRFWEDIHVAVPQANYGWNSQEGPLNNPNDPGNPILSYNHTNGPGLNDVPSSGSASITGGVIYRGGKFPAEFDGAYFYGDWTRQWIRYAKFDFSGARPVLIEDKFFSNSTGRPLSFEEGPDGALYYITTTQSDGDVFVFEGQVNRLSFDSDNTPPFGSGILVDAADLIADAIPHTVQFGSNVTDAEGDSIAYSWSFGDGGFSTDANPEHTFTDFGEYQVTLIATDANGAATAFNSVFIRIGNVPTINIQASQTNTYRAGDVITIDGSATDAIDGTIASGNLSWSSSYATDGAFRPGPFENNTPYSAGGITFTTPNFGNVESFLNSVTVSLRAENSNGLFASESITLTAETSSISIDAPNEEVLIAIDGHITTPGDYTFEGIVNFLFDFEADAQYVENGQTFSFSHWSDTPSNTNPIRRIAMPAVPTTITPVYVSEAGMPDTSIVFDFETGDLQGATITSGEFGQIVSDREFFIIGDNVPYDNGGDYFLNTLEIDSNLARGTDDFTGTITSPLYTLEGGTVSLLVGGGRNTNLLYFGVFLEDGTEIGRVGRDTNGESMLPMQIDVSSYIGQNIYWEVVDNSTSGWGYIAVDDIGFDGILVATNTSIVFDFETGDLQGATITSGEFGQIVSDREFFIIGDNVPYDNGGDYFLNTLEIDSNLARGTDDFTGAITSPLYTLEGGTVSLLVGGGRNTNLVYFGVFLEDGTEIGRVGRDTNGESMLPMQIDVSSYIGQNIYWEVVDNSTSGWGYIAVDDIGFDGTLLKSKNATVSSLNSNKNEADSHNVEKTFMFPNPASDYVNICFNDEIDIKQIHLYDSSGRIIESHQVNYNLIQNNTISIKTNHLKSGIYTIQLDLIDGSFEMHRLVVKHD